jgi:hypothetical protein
MKRNTAIASIEGLINDITRDQILSARDTDRQRRQREKRLARLTGAVSASIPKSKEEGRIHDEQETAQPNAEKT